MTITQKEVIEVLKDALEQLEIESAHRKKEVKKAEREMARCDRAIAKLTLSLSKEEAHS